MLIEESFHDMKTADGTTMRIYVYHPKIPNYPKVKFPGSSYTVKYIKLLDLFLDSPRILLAKALLLHAHPVIIILLALSHWLTMLKVPILVTNTRLKRVEVI